MKTQWPPKYEPSTPYDQQRADQYFHGRDMSICPPYNTIRFFGMYTERPFLQSILYTRDKTLKEWFILLKTYKQYDTQFPFLNGMYTILESLYFKHMRIRALLQKFVRNIKIRLLRRRIIGNIDLYTTLAIPKYAQITIHDYASKSVYMFHTQTAIRICESGLKYSNYGIPFPQRPKNPYTNLSFTYGQIVVLLQQIFVNCALTNSVPPINLISFRTCNYDTNIYKRKHIHLLNIESAKSLLLDIHDSNSRYYYMEVLEDTIESEDLRVPRWNIIKPYINDRSIPETIQTRLDTLVVSLFLYQNHSVCYHFKTYDKMLNTLEFIHNELVAWWKTFPRQILQRRLGVTAMAQHAPQNLTHV
jgi:hypothetical protein